MILNIVCINYYNNGTTVPVSTVGIKYEEFEYSSDRTKSENMSPDHNKNSTIVGRKLF